MQQQQWCSADPSTVGPTRVTGQTERKTNRARMERHEEETKLSSLIHPPADLGSNAAWHLLTRAIKMKPWQPLQLAMVSEYLAWIHSQ